LYRELVKYWAAKGMVRDLLACLPFDTIMRKTGHVKTASLVRGLRLLRISLLTGLQTKATAFLDRSVGRSWLRPIVQGVSLVLFTLFVNHVLACILYYYGHPLWDNDAVTPVSRLNETETRREGWVTRMAYTEVNLSPFLPPRCAHEFRAGHAHCYCNAVTHTLAALGHYLWRKVH
jgi:hypothetical protein